MSADDILKYLADSEKEGGTHEIHCTKYVSICIKRRPRGNIRMGFLSPSTLRTSIVSRTTKPARNTNGAS